MKTYTPILIGIGLLVSGLLGGFFLGRGDGPGGETADRVANADGVGSSSAPADLSSGEDGDMIQQMAERLRGKGGGLTALQSLIDERQTVFGFGTRYRDSILVIESLEDGDFQEAMGMVTDEDSLSNRQLRYLVFQSWADRDVDAAMNWLETQMEPTDPQFDNMAGSLVSSLAETDIAAAEAWIETWKGEMRRGERLYVALAGQLAETDPRQAIEYLRQRDLDGDPSVSYIIYRKWAAGNPQEAYAYVRQMDNPGQRTRALSQVFSVWFESDRETAVQALGQMEDAGARRAAVNSVIWQLAHSEPEAARQLVDMIPPGQSRSNMMSNILSNVARTDPEQAIRWYEESKNASGKGDGLSGLVRSWAETDPDGALAFAEGLTESAERNEAIRSVLGQMFQESPDAALAYVQSIEDPTERQRLMERNVWNFSREEPLKALAAADIFESPEKQKQYYDNVLSNFASQDPKGALAWYEENASSLGLESDLAPDLAGKLAENNLEMAIEFVNGISDTAVRDEALEDIVRARSRFDLSEAMGLAAQIGSEETRAKAVGTVIGEWAEYDPGGASKWLDAQPVGPERDSAIRRFTNQVERYDGEAATLWASQISDANQRTQSVRDSARQWLEQDREAAAQWIQQTDALNESAKQNLLGTE